MIERLLGWNGTDAEVIRAQVLNALGSLHEPSFCHFLLDHREDASPLVVREVIRSAGRIRDRQFITWLVGKLATTRYRAEARNALTSFDPNILGTLYDNLTDKTVSLSVRMNIPRVFSAIPSQESVNVLMRSRETLDPLLRHLVIKALSKIRGQYPNLRFDLQQVETWLIEETQSYYEHLQILHLYREVHEGPATNLFKKALQEKMNRTIEMIFRLLGLLYPPKDMYSAYHAFVGGEKRMRASAIEFLDSVLKKDVKRYLLPIVDGVSQERTIQKGQELFGIRIEQRGEALQTLLSGQDIWLKTCAIFTLSEFQTEELRSLVHRFKQDDHSVVRETADLVLLSGANQ